GGRLRRRARPRLADQGGSAGATPVAAGLSGLAGGGDDLHALAADADGPPLARVRALAALLGDWPRSRPRRPGPSADEGHVHEDGESGEQEAHHYRGDDGEVSARLVPGVFAVCAVHLAVSVGDARVDRRWNRDQPATARSPAPRPGVLPSRQPFSWRMRW